MTKIVLKVTDEQMERLDQIGILGMDMAGVLYQSVSIIPDDETKENKED